MRQLLHEQCRALVLPVLAATALLAAGCAGRSEPTVTRVQPAPPAPVDESVEITNEVLAERFRAIARRSPTWRAAMDSLRATGFQVLITDPAGVRARIPSLSNYRTRHLGEVLPVRDAKGRLIGAIVTIDVEFLSAVAGRAGIPRWQLHSDYDRILVHEVYGHVVPLAHARELVGGCPDPGPGEPAGASCAIVRENRIRRELGIEPRLAYDLRGLAVGNWLEDERAARIARAVR